MGAAMAGAVPAAAALYARANQVLGFDIQTICRDGPLERLTETAITQPALVATSLACLAAIDRTPDLVVGHSVGEYSALAAAGILSTDAVIALTRARGSATAAAAARAPGAMAAVIGLDDNVVEELCAGIAGVWPANYNCPGQLVVSGTVGGVDALIVAAEAAGARRAIKLKVAGGFHSPLTASAADDLLPALDAATFVPGSIPFFSTTSVRYETHETAKQLLVDQLGQPVRFTQTVQALRAEGVTTFVEVGSGSVLSGLVRRIDKGLKTVSVSTPDDLPKLQEALG